jgi:hypothetical protein
MGQHDALSGERKGLSWRKRLPRQGGCEGSVARAHPRVRKLGVTLEQAKGLKPLLLFNGGQARQYGLEAQFFARAALEILG